jgi:integrase
MTDAVNLMKKNTDIRAELFAKREQWNQKKKEDLTFQELFDEYMEYAPSVLKQSSLTVYRLNLRNHILGVFGEIKIKKIDNRLLSLYFCEYMDKQPNIARNTYHALCSVMNFAIRMNYIDKNPCDQVILPKVKHSTERKYLTFDELPAFMRFFDGNETLDVVVQLLLFTGLRIGEACALRWDDLDFSAGLIHVTKTIYRSGKDLIIGEPKSRNSRRTIVMGECVKSLLLQHRERQQNDKKRCSKYPEMVFHRKDGELLYEFIVWYHYKQRIKGSHFESMTLHDLRHTNATLLLNSGVDIKLVSSHLGHSQIDVTANIYTEVLSPAQQKIADITDKIFSENIASQEVS